ncbi:hypothetical protein J5N97_004096 [Dioscorea zingiberensis]|uniref:Uncharacterized protein n=1 Tax=Dioscorea zingiberensis TaxID=325984 RepID=A0A9D5HQL8_9LILI|nr:hypothetical protein J5N97_004096 [Dioscorea zingiberensis]
MIKEKGKDEDYLLFEKTSDAAAVLSTTAAFRDAIATTCNATAQMIGNLQLFGDSVTACRHCGRCLTKLPLFGTPPPLLNYAVTVVRKKQEGEALLDTAIAGAREKRSLLDDAVAATDEKRRHFCSRSSRLEPGEGRFWR